jgi:general stress protein 26
MSRSDSARRALAEALLRDSHELALATLRSDGSPHVTTVSYASDGLTIFAAIAIDSHKAHDIARDNRVSLAVNPAHATANQIRGLSIDATAHMLSDAAQLQAASALLSAKVPEYATLIAETDVHPWPGMLFIKITPHTVILLDYTLGFGHTEVFHPAVELEP